jgi:hypothetical protein
MIISIDVDLRTEFGTARDQGHRPTCLAFAASDCHAGVRSGWTPLSCEYAYFHAQRRGGRDHTSGAVLNDMLAVLKDDGQPPEANWPYLDTATIANGLPTPSAGLPELFRRNGKRNAPGFKEVMDVLANGQPALFSMTLSDSFYRPTAEGVVSALNGELPDPTRRHAMVAVGLGKVESEAAILARNSWGTGWGIDGHAWLPQSYLEPRLTRLAVLMEDMDVLSS